MDKEHFPDDRLADIYTEPEDVDPNTLNNLGPLAFLAGVWEGTKGEDTSPKAEGPEVRKYRERMVFEPIDPQANGPQLLYGLRYHVHINTDEEAITFHDQIGYWLWEPETGQIIQTVSIPRGLVAIASGIAKSDDKAIKVTAKRGESEYGICANSFLEQAFKTVEYTIEMKFNDDGTLFYESDTVLEVHGLTELFHHKDFNTLQKIKSPEPNPLFEIEGGK